MRIEQSKWCASTGWKGPLGELSGADLVLVFGGNGICRSGAPFEAIRRSYPSAEIVGCSTAGEIAGTEVSDQSLVATAVSFASSSVRCVCSSIASAAESYSVGREIGRALDSDGLVHVLVFSEGLEINGSELVRGLCRHLPASVAVTGGLAADGEEFRQTSVVWRGVPERDLVVAAGLYGEGLEVGFGSLGGWDPFGPERLVTRASGNVLHELDGRSALELYKLYLGEHASGLPAKGLYFPLSLRTDDGEGVVRTILAVDEREQTITFAGDILEGSYARFMKANVDRLIEGAAGAAKRSAQPLGGGTTELAVLISCAGRRMVLGQRVEEEVESVREVLGQGAVLTGFYSYGEISPSTPGVRCELHNQTMTITTFSEP